MTAAFATHPCTDYAELWCHSNFSFLHGASHPEELVLQSHSLGYQALALTDECSLAGVVRAHSAAKSCGLHLLIGTYVQIHNDDGLPWSQVVLLAKNKTGYSAISQLITRARRRSEKGQYHLKQSDLADALPGIICIVLPHPHREQTEPSTVLSWLGKRYAGRLWIGVHLARQGFDQAWLDHLYTLHAISGVPLVAVGHVLMHQRQRKILQDTLTAIAHNQSLEEARPHLSDNAEQHLRTRHNLSSLYPEELLQATLTIAAQCTFSLDELAYEYPDEIVPPGHTPASYLEYATWQGAQQRYPHGTPEKVRKQLNYELQLITELRYEAYFLTVFDIVNYARSQQILCQGRGSAANSAVCYCLHITEVNPDRGYSLFERFISRERNEPPDIDIDFEHQRREEVIRYIYIKYGRERAALAAALITYHPRSALRDVGKALGIEATLIDKVAKHHQWWDGKTIQREHIEQACAQQTAAVSSHVIDLWIQLTERLIGFPRHLSQHSGGFVIARGALSDLVPIENASMPERTVIQWDKNDLDAVGLLKIDILALGMLSAIKHTLAALSAKPGAPTRLQDIPNQDDATYDMLCQGDSIGVFQVESRAQMSMLPRLKPREYYDLVVQVAIVRPGPMQGGMVHPYLKNRASGQSVHYPSKALEPALKRTFGVPIFQEQVMQIAVIAAGFTPGEADQLRRAMAAWRRTGGVHRFYDRVIQGMTERGYTLDFAESIFRQIEGFGEYGFPESHAASFALIVYHSAWLKRHHPDAFLVGLLNAQPMGFYAPAQLIQDAKRHGVRINPIDINHSQYLTTLESPQTPIQSEHPPEQLPVRLGLHLIGGLSAQGAQRVEQARQQHPFTSVEDLARRAQLNQHDLQSLAHANALGSLAQHRHQAQWEVTGIDRSSALLCEARTQEQPVSLAPPTHDSNVLADYASQGFSLQGHPIALIRPQLKRYQIEPARTLGQYPHGKLARACGIVTHRQRPGTAKGVVFMTLEDETGYINVIVWPKLIEPFRQAVLHARIVAVFGIWQREGSVTHLVAKRLQSFDHYLQANTHSRDFR